MKNKIQSLAAGFGFLLVNFLSTNTLCAQMTINSAPAPESNIMYLSTGFDWTGNVQYHGQYSASGPSQIGSFSGYVPGFDFMDGIVLSTGNVDFIPGLSTSTINTTTGTGSDEHLESLTGYTYYDATSFEYDFYTFDDTLVFRIIFASEEYSDYVCNPQTDAMGVFLFGPGIPAPGVNIAKIAGTEYNIGINSVNNGTPSYGSVPDSCESLDYASLFVENYPTGEMIAFNGYTKALTIKYPIIPCETYHIKFVIADGLDSSFDSGLFIEATSMVACVPYFEETLTGSTGDSIPEETGMAKYTLHMLCEYSYDTYEPITIEGSAINGVDYEFVADSILIYPNTDTGSVKIIPIADGITEPAESVIISYQQTCNMWEVDTVWIYDGEPSLADFPESNTKLSVYPIPAIHTLNVTGIKPKTGYEISGITGITVKKGLLNDDQTISLEGLDDGFYMIRFENGVRGALKFIINR
ncbi:MAG: hypothetical protein A2W91_18390 [Bacteroidetes bacterium GWF2_38_335]|nr:MAG: hypothetical protein A2W91_18390 [Bacteroidetes bacterium GWF2_38_335]OFY80065.1 MAG: hypothetical protein A2281_12245 [Bacteroidetes bacterium RIFOXYA12_FULL_38_20]HBS88610.1 hypothetical protein [Bacteroidales bacterium]